MSALCPTCDWSLVSFWKDITVFWACSWQIHQVKRGITALDLLNVGVLLKCLCMFCIFALIVCIWIRKYKQLKTD